MLRLKSSLMLLIAFLVVAALTVIGCTSTEKTSHKTNKPAAGSLKITMLAVDHGDAILLQDGKQNIMIDTGEKRIRSLLMQKLEDLDVKKISTVVVSHHDSDHIGNIFPVIKQFKVDNVYDNGVPRETNSNSVDLHNRLKRGEYNNRCLKAGDTIKINDDYWFEVLSPGPFIRPDFPKQSNNNSVVMKLHYKHFTMLFTGDIEKPAEEVLVKKYGDELKADVLKVAHHGIPTSSTKPFIAKVAPKYAVISCGDHDKVGQPNIGIVTRLRNAGAAVYNTENNGDITIEVNDKGFSVKAAR